MKLKNLLLIIVIGLLVLTAQTPLPDGLVSWTPPQAFTRQVVEVEEVFRLYDFMAQTDRLYVGTAAGMFISQDQGLSWQDRSEGLPEETVIWSLLRVEDRLYAGTGTGLFISDDDGLSWQPNLKGFPVSSPIWSLAAVDGELFAATGDSGVFRSDDRGESWQEINTGLSTLRTTTLLANNGRLFVGTDGAGLFVSQTGGDLWREANIGLPNSIGILSLLAVEDWLYAGTNDGRVFASNNNGSSWRGANLPGFEGNVLSLLAAPRAEGEETRTILLAGTFEDGIFLSEDGGAIWRRADAGLPVNTTVNALFEREGRLYAGTLNHGLFISDLLGSIAWQRPGPAFTEVLTLLARESLLYAGTDDGVAISRDEGATWQSPVEGRLAARILSLLAVDDRLYAGTGDPFTGTGSVFLSEDEGQSWQWIGDGLPDSFVWALLQAGGNLYAGTDAGLFIREGESWQQLGEGLSGIRALRRVEERLYLGSVDQGLLVSEDAGQSWQPITEDLPENYIFRSLLVGQDRLYLGLRNNGIFMSRDGGQSWQQVMSETLDIFTLLARQGRIYAGTNAGVYVSHDGLTWQPANEGLPDNLSILTLLAAGNRLYAGLSGSIIYRSDDGGATWQPANNPAVIRRESARTYPLLIQDMAAADRLYLATRGRGVWSLVEGEKNLIPALPTTAAQNVQTLAVDRAGQVYAGTFAGLYYMNPTVQTLAWSDPPLPELTGDIQAVTTAGTSIYIVTGEQQLIKGENEGLNWRPLAAPVPGLRTVQLLVGPEGLYAATNQGLYLTMNEGQQWETVLPDENIHRIARAGDNIYYVATASGVYKATDGWETITRLFSGNFTSVVVDPFDSNIIYAAAPDRLLFSSDGGSATQEMSRPEGMTVDILALSPTAQNRLWVADSRQGSVSRGSVNPNYVAPLVWPRVALSWAISMVVLAGVIVVGLAHYSGLPILVLLRQRLMLFPIALSYRNYRHRWQSLSLAGRLLMLLIPPKEGSTPDQLGQKLDELDVPIGMDQLENELTALSRTGLLQLEDGRYCPTERYLAQTLQDAEGQAGWLKLIEQIRYDHPLSINARRFLERAGFSLIPVADPLLYRAESTSVAWQNLLPAEIYTRFLPGETLDAQRVLALQKQVQQVNSHTNLILAITDRRPTESGWAQIGTLRISGFTLLPLDNALLNEGLSSGRERAVLRAEVEQRLGSDYDPYDVRDPVAGAFSFFGRDALVETLLRRVNESRPVGIFGLRKLGKSSLLHALRDRTAFPVAEVNLQTIGRTGRLTDLYRRIFRYWGQQINLKTDLAWSPPSLPAEGSTGAFVDVTLDLLDRLEPDAQLGLFLDEIELLVPRPDGSGPDLQRYLTLLRTLRGLVDEDGRLSLVVASLNPAINRINGWGGEQNPTFNLFQEINLPPLDREACIHMIRNIGLQVGLVYSEESLAEIADLSGGHPFLARQFCSLLFYRRDYRAGQVEATEIPQAVQQFIYDNATLTHLDHGLWQEAGNPTLWGEPGAQTNQIILLDIAGAETPPARSDLLHGPNADARRAALLNLERYHYIYQPEPGRYAIQFGLLREWLRKRKLGK